MEKINYNLQDVIGSSQAISLDDAVQVKTDLAKIITARKYVTVDFKGIDLMISAFLNKAVGDLYGECDKNDVDQFLNAINLCDDDKVLFDRVIERAKSYYEDKKAVEERLGDVFDEK